MDEEMILEDLLPVEMENFKKETTKSKRQYYILVEKENYRRKLTKNFGERRRSLIIFLSDDDPNIMEFHKRQILLFPYDIKLKDALASVMVKNPKYYTFWHGYRRTTYHELNEKIDLLFSSGFFFTPIAYLCGVKNKKHKTQLEAPIELSQVPPHLEEKNFPAFYEEYIRQLKQECKEDNNFEK